MTLRGGQTRARSGFPSHGGDLDFATARYGTPVGGWLDLSTGVNPHPYPADPVAPDTLARLPAAGALDRLLAAARHAYSVLAPAAAIAAVPGTDLALRLLPLVVPPGPVAIVSPTYSGHVEAWRDRAPRIVRDPTATEAAMIVVLANPNNPDGRRTDPEVLVKLAAEVAQRGGVLVVDEAFADAAPDLSIIPHIDALPIIALRSFGKFFGLPGLRLGFVVGRQSYVQRLAALLGDWPVSTPAIAIGTAALSDTAWRSATRSRLATDASLLRTLLGRHRLTVLGGTDLFVLVETADAFALHQRLARAGIWTRAFAEHPTWLRFGLTGDAASFQRLDDALQSVL